MVSGIGIYLDKRIDIGDIIVDSKKGTIVEFHLMKTVALTDKGECMNVPNLKFSESIILVSHKEKK